MNLSRHLVFLIFISNSLIFCAQKVNPPIIKNISWGKVTVLFEGSEKVYKDVKVYPNGVKEWDWNLTNTKHKPGIQIADIIDIVDFADVIILSQGMKNMLHIMEETKKYLTQKGKKFHIKQSEEAVNLYNQLVKENKKVAIILHSTC